MAAVTTTTKSLSDSNRTIDHLATTNEPAEPVLMLTVTFRFPKSPSHFATGYAVRIVGKNGPIDDFYIPAPPGLQVVSFKRDLPEGAKVRVDVRAVGDKGRTSAPVTLTYVVPPAPLDPPGAITAEPAGAEAPPA